MGCGCVSKGGPLDFLSLSGLGSLSGVSLINTPDVGPENALGPGDGETAQTLRDRLDMALRYISNWYKASEDSANKNIWWAKIDSVRSAVQDAEDAMDPAKVFPGNTELSLYNDAATAFPALWRELTLSSDINVRLDLLSALPDFIDTTLNMPGYIVQKVVNGVTDAAGNVAGKAARNLWPYALAGGAILAFLGYRKYKTVKRLVVGNPRRRRRYR